MRNVLIGLFITSLTLGACSKRDASQEDRAADRSDPDVVASREPVVVPEAGVRFDPPSAWPRERYRLETKSGNDAAEEQAGAAHWVALHYQPEQPGNEEASLCRIVVLTRDGWMRIEAEAGPPIGTMIESLDAWVYLAQLPQSNPYPPGSPDAEQFDAMRLSIRDVRARFSMEGDGPSAANASDTGEL